MLLKLSHVSKKKEAGKSSIVLKRLFVRYSGLSAAVHLGMACGPYNIQFFADFGVFVVRILQNETNIIYIYIHNIVTLFSIIVTEPFYVILAVLMKGMKCKDLSHRGLHLREQVLLFSNFNRHFITVVNCSIA